jgi:glycosyltransferase involved in cell wall biosynthesis
MQSKIFPSVSVVIRTKNESKWIWKTLKAIKNQSIAPDEIVVIDNLSQDSTISLARDFGATKIKSIRNYSPGRALNFGIEQTSGEIVVILSAHCIPIDEYWLENLILPFVNHQIAATYGRQLPLPFTVDNDKSDLYAVFRNESQIQNSDGFMNNANSAIRRSIWEQFKFNESITNVEDRVWGAEIVARGFKIAYISQAGVFHHNGMHKSGERSNQTSTVNVLETMIFKEKQNELQQYRKLFEKSFLPIVIVNKEENVTQILEALKEFTGYATNYFLDPVTLFINFEETNTKNHVAVSDRVEKQLPLETIKAYAKNQLKDKNPEAQYFCFIFSAGPVIHTHDLLSTLDKIIIGNQVFATIGGGDEQPKLMGILSGDEGIAANFVVEVDYFLTQV